MFKRRSGREIISLGGKGEREDHKGSWTSGGTYVMGGMGVLGGMERGWDYHCLPLSGDYFIHDIYSAFSWTHLSALN